MSVKNILTNNGGLNIGKVDGSFQVDGDLTVRRNIINELLTSRLISIEQQLTHINEYHGINTETDNAQTTSIQQLRNDVNNLIIAVSLLWDTVSPQQE